MYIYIVVFLFLVGICAFALYSVISSAIHNLKDRRINPALFITGLVFIGIGVVIPLLACFIVFLTKFSHDSAAIIWLVYPFPVMVLVGGLGAILLVIFNNNATTKPYRIPKKYLTKK